VAGGARGIEIGVDIGGTFTDVVCRDSDGVVRLVKIPTTRSNPSAGVGAALELMRRDWSIPAQAITRFVHGTTAATNAVLEGKGAKIGLLTTEGFRDVLEIGRQMRHAMYDLMLEPEAAGFLAPGHLRKEVRERVTATGAVLVPLDEASVERAVGELKAEGVAAIAVSLLFSFLNPAHEIRIREIIERLAPDLMVSLSSEVDPAFREYERTCVTAFDAYLKPVVDRYLASMERDLARAGVKAPLQIMQSRGGIASSRIARRRPVRLFLSGPAAGVMGGLDVGQALGLDDLITVDVGGTSCDIALVSGGRPLIRSEGAIGGYTVRVPMVDVNAIGAGGGSIAWIDDAGSLRVGPESAGSEPGPACYDRGGKEPTVTDASILLGYNRAQNRGPARDPDRDRGARHSSRAQRPDGRGDPAGLDRPRHRPSRLHAGASGWCRALACDGARARAWHHPHRRAAPPRSALRSGAAARSHRARDLRGLSASTRGPRLVRGASRARRDRPRLRGADAQRGRRLRAQPSLVLR
jgi:N-methylhydantoinase A/oxoprolinase/acetone carboxylase beta subunit